MMAKTVLDVLIEARDLIANIEQWGQENNASDANNEPVEPTSSLACIWCAQGALGKVSGPNTEVFYQALTALQKETQPRYGMSIIRVNDGFAAAFNYIEAHRQVIELFDVAISKARTEAVEIAEDNAAPRKLEE
jgi:hypothetical protein